MLYSLVFCVHKSPMKSPLRPYNQQTRTHCCGHIVAHDVSWAAQIKLGNIFCGHKMFLNKSRNFFCVPDTKFVSATNDYVARAGKRGNICVGNNVSSFARALSHLKSPKVAIGYVMLKRLLPLQRLQRVIRLITVTLGYHSNLTEKEVPKPQGKLRKEKTLVMSCTQLLKRKW